MHKKLLFIILVINGICFTQSNFKKGIGITSTYSTDHKSLVPGLSGKMYYVPNFTKINKFELAIQFEALINGMVYKNVSNDERGDGFDLEVNQLQSIDITIQRGFNTDSILLTLLSLQNSERNFSNNFNIKNMFERISYYYTLNNIGLEVFVRKTNNNPIAGVIFIW